MKNHIVIHPAPGYTDTGFVNFVNSVSDNVTEQEAERLQVALSGFVIICPDEETAAREVARGREGLTNEAHNGFVQACEATGERRFDWRSGFEGAEDEDGPAPQDDGDEQTSDEETTSLDEQQDASDAGDDGADDEESDPSESSTENDEESEDEE